MSVIRLRNVEVPQTSMIEVVGGSIPEKFEYGLGLLRAQFPVMVHIPEPEYRWGNLYIPCKRSGITLRDVDMILAPDCWHATIGIPPIAYNTVKEVLFDTFLNHSTLVSIWIKTDLGVFTVQCY